MTTIAEQAGTAQTLRSLKAWRPAGKVLSVYLDTSAPHVAGYAYVTAFRDGCRTVRSALPAADEAAFDTAAEAIDRYLREQYQGGAPGVAAFSSGAALDLYALRLPVPPSDSIAWEQRPRLDVLDEDLDAFGRAAVVLFDKEEARIFTVLLGEIETRERVVDYVPDKQSSGGWFALSQTRVARRREEHILRHVKHTLTELPELDRRLPYQWLILGGASDALHLLHRHLPPTLMSRTIGTINVELFANEATILRAASDVLAEHAQRAEREEVDALLAAEPGTTAVLGPHATIAALNDRRVHRLILADQAEFSGAVCAACAALADHQGACSVCGSETQATDHLRSFVVDRVHQQGAGLAVIHGDAAAPLLARAGIGAWVRF